jgi:ketol-acid reductoisomerase
MAKIYYEKDASLEPLKGKTVAVVGYGIQGRAQALNLRDSGVRVVVGVREYGESWKAAKRDGMRVAGIRDAVAKAQVVMMLVPDEVMADVYEKQVAPHVKAGATVDFAHGFNVRFGAIKPARSVDVVMVAPKGPGAAVRETYEKGWGVPALVAVHQDASGRAKETALALAHGIGATRVGVVETTFAEETETDLFGEQVDLCGGVASMIQASFDTLVKAGYQPELAYFEVLHELKMIVDLVQKGGLEGMWESVSNTAEFGGRTRGPLVVDSHVRKNMELILEDVRSGAFAREWIEEWKAGAPTLNRMREDGAKSRLETVGREVRRMFAPSAPPVPGKDASGAQKSGGRAAKTIEVSPPVFASPPHG